MSSAVEAAPAKVDIKKTFDVVLKAARAISEEASSSKTTRKKVDAVAKTIPQGTATVQVSATLSTNKPAVESAYAAGNFSHKNHPLSCTRETVVFWRRKRYILTLNIPIPREEGALTENETKDLKKFIEKSKFIFIGELDKATNDDSKIRPGDDFDFLVTDKGFTAYTLTTDKNIIFNPEDDSIEDAIASGYFSSYTSVTSPVARKLSEVIQSCNPEHMVKELETDDLFASYRASPKEAQESEIYTFRPVPLQNFTGTVCYLNTAFQQFASNPAIRQELLNRPELIQGEKNSPLYKALKAYDKEQSSKTPQTLNLSELKKHLGLVGEQQDDAHVAMQAIQRQLVEKADSKLFSQMKTQLSYNDTNNKEVWIDSDTLPSESMLAQRVLKLKSGKIFQQLYEQIDTPAQKTQTILPDGSKVDILHKREVYVTEPDIEYIYINRIHTDRTTLSDLGKTAFIDQLKSKTLSADELGKLFEVDIAAASDVDKIRLATAILNDDTKFELAFSKLEGSEKNAIGKQFTKTKVTDDIDVPLEWKGRELCSFGAHDGSASGGHHYTYVKDGNTYWKLSDEDVVKFDDAKEFMERLKNATSLVYTKKALIEASSGPAKSAVSGELTDLILCAIYDEKTTVKVGVGDITQRPGTIVNFTNPTLDQQTSIYTAGLKDIIHAVREKKSSRFNKEGIFSAGTVVQSKPGNGLAKNGVKKIVHAVIGLSPPNNPEQKNFISQLKKLVKASLEKAHDGKDKHIAFTLPEGIPDALIVPAYNAMLAEINSYAKKHAEDLDYFETIEIVLTPEQREAITKKPPVVTPAPPIKITEVVSLGPDSNTSLVIGKGSNPAVGAATTGAKKESGRLQEDIVKKIQSAIDTSATEVTIDLRSGAEFDPARYSTSPQGAITTFQNVMVELVARSSPQPLKVTLIVPLNVAEFDRPVQLLQQFANVELTIHNFSATPAKKGQVAYVGTINEAPFIVETSTEIKAAAASVLSDKDLGKAIEGTITLINDDELSKSQEEFIFDLRPGASQAGKIGNVDVTSHNIGPSQDSVGIFLAQLAACKNPNKKPIRIILPQWLPSGTLVRIDNALIQLKETIQLAKIKSDKGAISGETPVSIGKCTFQNGSTLFVERSTLGNPEITPPLTKEEVLGTLNTVGAASVTIDLRGTEDLKKALQNFHEVMIGFVKTTSEKKVTLIVPKEAEETTIQTQLFEIADSQFPDYKLLSLKGKVRHKSDDGLQVVSTQVKKTNADTKKTPKYTSNDAPAAKLISDIKTQLGQLTTTSIQTEIILDIRPGDADTTLEKTQSRVSLDLRDYQFENPGQALRGIITALGKFENTQKKQITLILPEDEYTRAAVNKKSQVEGLMTKASEANSGGGLLTRLYNLGAWVKKKTYG